MILFSYQMAKVYEYINSLIEMIDESEKYKECHFSILCERYP